MTDPLDQQARWDRLAAAPADEMFGRLFAAERFALLSAESLRKAERDEWDAAYSSQEILDALTDYVPRGARSLPGFMPGFNEEIEHIRRTLLGS